jgi:hypothetical protein
MHDDEIRYDRRYDCDHVARAMTRKKIIDTAARQCVDLQQQQIFAGSKIDGSPN